MVDMRNIMLQMQIKRHANKARIESILAHNKMLENQLAQLATLKSTRQQGALPAQPVQPTYSANANTLHSGSHYNGPPMLIDDTVSVRNDEERVQDESETDKENFKQVTEHGETIEAKKPAIEVPPIKLPFPNRQFKSKLDKQLGKFFKVVKNLQVTILFTELITQVPAYAKFTKDILTRKRAFNEVETVTFTEEGSAFLQNKSPSKFKDPRSFSIPCHIGRLFIDKALCDFGASVSLMPLFVSSKLNMGSLKFTNITLQMADRSIKYPLGILEDVPVIVGKFFIPVDFVVLDMEEDTQFQLFWVGHTFILKVQ
ncbi:uncharacterized protein LOC125494135 [Beta vulgaris subsp. vulgaris]|uniref:uncharacterized protein LOC125494135 n=1 Tax=Beta vulgaris subsp. vulgaris TaxID=3555 RepID=UPI0020368930|nr:uncharacterized protein LOC125494135 [Beta vulgaris subsp. vulgaris]